MTTPLCIYNTSVHSDWIDYNGHMNAGYYNVVIDDAATALMVDLGWEAHMAQTGGTYYSVETHIIYKQELKLDAPLRVETQIVSYDRKRVHLFATIYHAEENYAAATGETMMLYFNQRSNRVEPMPDDLFGEVEAMAARHAAVPHSADVSRAIRTVKKK